MEVEKREINWKAYEPDFWTDILWYSDNMYIQKEIINFKLNGLCGAHAKNFSKPQVYTCYYLERKQ